MGLFGLALHLLQPAVLTRTVALGLAVLLVARVVLAFVPTDGKGQGASRRGRAHLAIALVLFAAAYTAVANATPALAAQPFFPWLGALRWVCAGSLAAVVATMLLPGKRYFGLAERGFLVGTLLWFLVASLGLFTGARAA